MFPSFFWSVLCPPRPFVFLLLFIVSPSCCFFVLSLFGVRGGAVGTQPTQPCPFPPCNEASSSDASTQAIGVCWCLVQVCEGFEPAQFVQRM